MHLHLKVVVILLLNTGVNYLGLPISVSHFATILFKQSSDFFFADNSDNDEERGSQIDKRIILTTPEVSHATDYPSDLYS